MLPFPVILGLVAAQMGRLIARHGYRRYLILGPALAAAGMGWTCFLPVHGNYPLHLLPGLLVIPAGYGISFPSAYAAATSGVPARRAGLAAGLIATAQQVGGAVGLAVISAVATSYTASLTRDSVPQALTSGYNLAMAVAAGVTLLASVIAATVIRVRRPVPSGPSAATGLGTPAEVGKTTR
jgi:MFS family permease